MTGVAMIFAAGFGRRLHPKTLTTPKPLIPIAGTPIIEHALAWIGADSAMTKCLINAHHLASMLVDYLNTTAHTRRFNVQTLCEHPDILDTGGGLKNALPYITQNPLFTLNCDAIWQGDNPIDALRTAWRPNDMDALLLLIPRAHAHGYQNNGDFDLNSNGQIVVGQDFVYTGAQIICTKALPTTPQDVFSMRCYWQAIAARRRLYGVVYTGDWYDVGNPKGLALAESYAHRHKVMGLGVA